MANQQSLEGPRTPQRRSRWIPVALALGVAAAAIFILGRNGRLGWPGTPLRPVVAVLGKPSVKTWDFEDGGNSLGREWRLVTDGWQIIEDRDAPSGSHVFGLRERRFFPSLADLDAFYPLALVTHPAEVSDFRLEATFESVGGSIDASGGLVFRYQNRNNYYVLAAGCTSETLALFVVKDGRRQLLGQMVEPFARNKWYRLGVDAVGYRITCYLNRRVIFRVNSGTFLSGGVGLWAKADSQVRFDDLRLEVYNRRLAAAAGGI